MSEFVEVMKQYNRMNDAHKKGTSIPVEASLSNAVNNPDFFEKIVTVWAAEHPEPVYPSWGEWLIEQGIAEIGSGMLAIDPSKAVEHIPDDLAQKLGLKPKGD